MNRPTADTRTALTRLAEVMGFAIEREGSLYVLITPHDASRFNPKNSTAALAILADLTHHLTHGERLREVVNWTGRPPQQGLAGWEQTALEWLTQARIS